MKTLIPIALLLLLLIALDSPKIKKQRELLTSGYWTCSQNVYDKDKNKIGTAESLVRYLPSGRSRPPHHSLNTIKVSHNSGLKFTMIMNSTWDLESVVPFGLATYNSFLKKINDSNKGTISRCSSFLVKTSGMI